MNSNNIKAILLSILLLSTYNIYAAETGSVDSTPQEAEVLNKNRTILMGVDFGGSTNFMTTPSAHTSSPPYHDIRALIQSGLTYRYYYYPHKIQDKIKNGIGFDLGFLYSIQADSTTPKIGKSGALYLTGSVLYSLNSYGISAYNNLLFNIGFNVNIFIKQLKTGEIKELGYSYNFAQFGFLMEIGYAIYTPNFKSAIIFKLLFKGLTEDVSPGYSYKFSLYIGCNLSLLFNSN